MEEIQNGTWEKFYERMAIAEKVERERKEKMNSAEETKKERSLIKYYFTENQIKQLYTLAMNPDIEDNNERARIVADIIGPEFLEIGSGTNRTTVMRCGMIYKIALDYRGMIDNLTEFSRSPERPDCLTKSYETNMLVLVAEYVTVMDLSEFQENADGIREILADLSQSYIFDDLGLNPKNHMNWGYRTDMKHDGDIVALDYGYLYPIRNPGEVLICQKCGGRLRYNDTFTGFICTNKSCRNTYRIMDIRRRVPLDIEDEERERLRSIMECKLPDFN